MVSRVTTVAFQGIEAVPVDVQVQIAPGGPVFAIVGLPDKAVGESRERIRCALHASGLVELENMALEQRSLVQEGMLKVGQSGWQETLPSRS